MIERTLCVIKPNATKKNKIGAIIAMLEDAGLTVVALRLTNLSAEQVGAFYEEHVGQPYYEPLKTFMTSGPVVGMVLEGEDAIARSRAIMGVTDPEKAAEGTIRKLYADSMRENAVHGSDSPAAAEREIAFYFDKFSII